MADGCSYLFRFVGMSYDAAPMDSEQVSRDELLAVIAQQQTVIAELQATIGTLEARVHELERRLAPGGARGMPGLKPEQAAESNPRRRQRRRENSARRRQVPTRQVVHAVAACPGCGTALVGGSVKRTREVLDVVLAPVEVVEHVYWERRCPGCGRRCVPAPELGGQVLGQQRLGVGLLSLIATLREEGRLPIATIQWYLATYHQCPLSRGAIVAALHRVAQQARPTVAAGLGRIRAGPFAQADETGWRENGRNGYVWTFSTPTEQVFVRRRRTKEVVDEVLGPEFSGVLVSDFYAAYHHYPGLKQRCWAHLLRDIHELRTLYPQDRGLARWATAVHRLYTRAVAYRGKTRRARYQARRRFEQQLERCCAPWAERPAAVQRKLCARILRHLKELFVFVAEPMVPPDNNGAERSLRHLVTSRKISGGTRSAQGTDTKLTLCSLFGTWRAQRVNPFLACRQLLASPQV
jgi:transposase